MSHGTFLEDDYFEVEKQFFNKQEELLKLSSLDHNYVSTIDNINVGTPKYSELIDYHNDEAGLGEKTKNSILEILRYEGEQVNCTSQITISPSITSASINVINFLMEVGIKNAVVETPCYYATKYQLEKSQIRTKLVPSFLSGDFQWEPSNFRIKKCVYWLTQPRISLTKNQNIEAINKILSYLEADDSYLVIDEATELISPSYLNDKLEIESNPRVIRMRGLLKQFGINGLRLSYLLHSKSISQELKKSVWLSHGGIDCFSANNAINMAKLPSMFVEMKELTLKQVMKLHKRINAILIDSPIKILDLDNGYTACLVIPLSRKLLELEEYMKKRIILIEILHHCNILPTLSASMFFAFDGKNEFVRLNYLNDPVVITKAILQLSSVFRERFPDS